MLCAGAFQTLRGIRDAIAGQDCDAVTMVRPLLANPKLPNKILAAEAAGRADYEADEPCSLCNRCLLAAPEFPVGCLDDRRYERYPQGPKRYDAMINALFDLLQMTRRARHEAPTSDDACASVRAVATAV